MWLQRGEVPEQYRPLRHLGSTLLNVASVAGFKYSDNNIDLSQCLGFVHHETLMVRLEEEGLKKVTGTVIGLITPNSTSLKIAEIAKGKMTKEVMRLQAHHYLVIPDFTPTKAEKLKVHFYAKPWAVSNHQPGVVSMETWGTFLSFALQFLFRMDHPTDRSVQLEAEALLDTVMIKARGGFSRLLGENDMTE
jgi:hypothetical protein